MAHEARGLPRQYPAGARVRWQRQMGYGFGGATIWEDSVLVVDRVRGETDVVRRINLSDGSDIWHHEYAAAEEVPYPGSRSTPATDGQMVWTVGTLGHVKALRFSDGKAVWQKHLMEDWNARMPRWAVSQSPLLLGELVILNPWGKNAAVVAYEKNTGKVAWTTPNRSGKGPDYQSPVPMHIHGRVMVVASAKNGYTIGVDPRTGQELWSYGGYNCAIHVPSPTAVPGNRVLLTGGYGAGSAMFGVARTSAGGYETRELWKNKNLGTRTAQALVWNGHIYANSYNTRGGLRCLNLDGEILWDSADQRRRFGLGYLLIADGLVFIINGNGGEITVAEATPRAYRELGRVDVLDGDKVWAPIAYDDGVMIVRDQRKMVCLDLK